MENKSWPIVVMWVGLAIYLNFMDHGYWTGWFTGIVALIVGRKLISEWDIRYRRRNRLPR